MVGGFSLTRLFTRSLLPAIHPTRARTSMVHSTPFSILRTVEEVRDWRNHLPDPSSIGFVPTMGALHEGHLQLVRHSLSTQQNTIVSIFLNPAQFGPTEDLSSYPSTLESDLKQLSALQVKPGSHDIPHDGFDGRTGSGTTEKADRISTSAAQEESARKVSAVFLPTNEVLYPSGIAAEPKDQRGAFVIVHGLSEQLEGARRPGFFRGVATVVLKLFMIVEPTLGFFGQKDLQQCLLVRQLCKDLHLIRPRAIVAAPTVRDSSTGLALSSRNAYLSPSEAKLANALFTFLHQSAQKVLASGHIPTLEELANSFDPPHPSFSLDFVSINDPITFNEIPSGTKVHPHFPIAISGAMLVDCSSGRLVRLIDNVVINHDLNHAV
ncbi:pantothenate synthase [Puccinia graminis f. sp. tritici]|uniref:Pantoate--beta-alanine ligase n=2 Tax=Puccinia graminis f. sp. tritici TaxID=56615 RepID=E3KRR2_PUCGT|nr:uncharacterized protein PGTG_12728 [Puccinia graminis f. sp. tritici CRL 75-36-700-3]EFP86987.2 hypothetical protein PGTG_12728 [Puccinia graminis f. sp. tritici CRL 75-36-700-3]KAA1101868.1 pantothenate synthase [Puccinia graminis f. sp. tritici]